MEYSNKHRPKLSLSSTYSKLHSTLWQQKQKNCFLEKQNIILNTKINSKDSFKPTANQRQQNQYLQQKKKLQQKYEQIHYQQLWMKDTISLIEQKNYQKQYKKKSKIEQKLTKTNKKCKELSKKLNSINQKMEQSQHSLNRNSRSLALNQQQQCHQHKQISPQEILSQLQKQNQQLTQIHKFKVNQLNQQGKKVNVLNSQIIELLSLKNWLKKYTLQYTKSTKQDLFNTKANSTWKQNSSKTMPQAMNKSGTLTKNNFFKARNSQKLKIQTIL